MSTLQDDVSMFLFRLQDSGLINMWGCPTEAIKAFLNSTVDSSQLEEMKKASALVEAPNSDRKPDINKLKNQLLKADDIQQRNEQIVKAYEKGYSQQMIATVLGITQQAVYAVVKRSRV